MPENQNGAVLDRLWRRFEERFGPDDAGCGCLDSSTSVEALRESQLSRADLEAFRVGERSMDELVATLDADVDPGTVDDLADLTAALERADGRDQVGGDDPS